MDSKSDYEDYSYYLNGYFRIFIYSISMLIGSYIAGYLPLMFTLSEKMITYTSSLGAGLLIGTALAVIIPEGVQALYSIGQSSSVPELIKDRERREDMVLQFQREGPASVSYDLSHFYLGAVLTSGFLMMLLIDQIIFRDYHGNDNEDLITSTKLIPRNRHGTATLGLLVHSAVDGVALGAAAASAHSHVEIVIFLAIMLHKAPAAFGLTSILQKIGYDRRKIKRHLFAFSITAPIVAILIYMLLFHFKSDSKSIFNDKLNGIALLFSAGTFLYVATVHVIPELSQSRPDKLLSKSEIFCITVGAILPIFFSFTHQH